MRSIFVYLHIFQKQINLCIREFLVTLANIEIVLTSLTIQLVSTQVHTHSDDRGALT
jgi:hypothetical protein